MVVFFFSFRAFNFFFLFFFFFSSRRRHTRFDCDWSSDVCSSDLWNLARLVKRQQKEADREGPGRPVTMPSIEITDARVSVRDVVGTTGITVPKEIGDLDVKASFEIGRASCRERVEIAVGAVALEI